MEIIVVFFRDILSGFRYVLYLLICIFSFFYVFGIVANRKRNAINKKLKEKKTYDIESGREAEIAAMETKQILDVEEEDNINNQNPNATLNNAVNSMNAVGEDSVVKEDTPNVMVLNSTETQNNEVNPLPISTEPTQTQEQPLVIDTSNMQQ